MTDHRTKWEAAGRHYCSVCDDLCSEHAEQCSDGHYRCAAHYLEWGSGRIAELEAALRAISGHFTWEATIAECALAGKSWRECPNCGVMGVASDDECDHCGCYLAADALEGECDE
ncbi:MAG: hypothetical protein GF320_21870 [Armatimonadia bacterium]|nr:hypothetical protein [Armatimonadia bacterium]